MPPESFSRDFYWMIPSGVTPGIIIRFFQNFTWISQGFSRDFFWSYRLRFPRELLLIFLIKLFARFLLKVFQCFSCRCLQDFFAVIIIRMFFFAQRFSWNYNPRFLPDISSVNCSRIIPDVPSRIFVIVAPRDLAGIVQEIFSEYLLRWETPRKKFPEKYPGEILREKPIEKKSTGPSGEVLEKKLENSEKKNLQGVIPEWHIWGISGGMLKTCKRNPRTICERRTPKKNG